MWDNPVTYLVALGAVSALVTAGIWVGNVNSDRETFRKFMTEVKADLREIRTGVWTLLGNPAAIESRSPAALTEYGEKIADAIGAVAWAKKEAVTLKDEIKGKRGYEIEERAFAYVSAFDLSPSVRETMWEHSYRVEHVQDVLAVVLRDELLNYR